MRAFVLHAVNDFQMGEVEVPSPKPDEVLLEVRAAGICGSDIPRIYETGAHRMPLILGHEFSGVVTGIGKEVKGSWLGKRVGVFPLIPCKSCAPCRAGRYEMCRGYSYLGSRTDGAFAEYAVVPEWNLVELPDEVSFESAAMLEPMAVAVHAMRSAEKAGWNRQKTVAVCGLGTIGLLLVMFLKECGVENLLVIGNKVLQKQKILELGISGDSFCDAVKQDAVRFVMERTGGSGADLFFECVGISRTVNEAVGSTAPAGTVVLVGNPASDIDFDRNIYWRILRNQLVVRGCWNSSFDRKGGEDDWCYALKRLSRKTVDPERLITHRLSLEELAKGTEMMRDKTEAYIKVMVRNR